jgi:hypothetical protein
MFHRSRFSRRTSVVRHALSSSSLLALVCCAARVSNAQEPAAPSPEPAAPPPAPLTPEPAAPAAPVDLSAIEAALARDAAAAPLAPSPPSRVRVSPQQSLNPDISLIGDFALAAFSPNEPHQTGNHDPQAPGFNLQQLELSFGSAVDPYFRFDGQLVFSLEAVEIEEAFATTLDLPAALQVRFGMMLTRFGRLNSTHLHVWDFADQPFMLGRVFGGEGNRGLGVELSWLTPLPWYAELVASATNADGEGSARSFYGEESPGVGDPGDLLYVTALKQFFAPSADWSVLWGLSGAFGPNASREDARTEIYATDLYVKYRPLDQPIPPVLTLQTEWLYRRRDLLPRALHDYGGYVQLGYRFAQRWGVAGRYEYGSVTRDPAGTPTLDPLDPEWTSNRRRGALSLSFHPTEFSRFRIQGGRDTGVGPGVWSAFLTAEVATGAHGAHEF